MHRALEIIRREEPIDLIFTDVREIGTRPSALQPPFCGGFNESGP